MRPCLFGAMSTWEATDEQPVRRTLGSRTRLLHHHRHPAQRRRLGAADAVRRLDRSRSARSPCDLDEGRDQRHAGPAAHLARVMETPLGQTVADDLAIPVIDLYVHAWDLGVAVDIAVEIPAGVVDFAHSYIDPLPDELIRGDNRAFGPLIKVPASATPTERFIAWTGRRPPGVPPDV